MDEGVLDDDFRWKLKEERDKKRGKQLERGDERRRRLEKESAVELERVKRRRIERDMERMRRDDLRKKERGLSEEPFLCDKAEEDAFVLKQANERARIRIKNGRASLFDVVRFSLGHLDVSDDLVDSITSIDDPVVVISSLSEDELNAFKEDVSLFLKLDSPQKIDDLWKPLLILCEDEFRRREPPAKVVVRSGLHSSVLGDVGEIFKGKTHRELELLERQIGVKMQSGASVDIEYWEGLLEKLKSAKAAAKLREIHLEFISQIKKLPPSPSKKFTVSSQPSTDLTHFSVKPETTQPPPSELKTFPSVRETRIETPLEKRKRMLQEEVAKLKARAFKSNTGTGSPFFVQKPLLSEQEMYSRELQNPMHEGEQEFCADVPLPDPEDPSKGYPSWTSEDLEKMNSTPHLTVKKPRFLNRTISGYDWNPHNKTHYDTDNPPPKLIKGYKFTIFYPELLDPSRAPAYSHEKMDDPDSLLLRFSSGAPYQDVAFEIANRPWDLSQKAGFRCTFERGILRLWFWYKRVRYRR